jgi:hypothetical protein
MTIPTKSSSGTNPIGGEGGTPGLEIEETISETITVKATIRPQSTETNPIGGEGGTPGVD